MQLVGQSCQLCIEEFDESSYKVVGYYPQDISAFPCTHLEVREGLLLTSYQKPLLTVNSAAKTSSRETTLTIDDLGIIRLIAMRFPQDALPSEETWVSYFRSPKQYLYSTSSI